MGLNRYEAGSYVFQQVYAGNLYQCLAAAFLLSARDTLHSMTDGQAKSGRQMPAACLIAINYVNSISHAVKWS